MPSPRFAVTHPTRGNLLWRVDGQPHYFKSADAAQAALHGIVVDSRDTGFAAGFDVVQLTPAEQHAAHRCQSLHHGR